jgi:hypothetical protein
MDSVYLRRHRDGRSRSLSFVAARHGRRPWSHWIPFSMLTIRTTCACVSQYMSPQARAEHNFPVFLCAGRLMFTTPPAQPPLLVVQDEPLYLGMALFLRPCLSLICSIRNKRNCAFPRGCQSFKNARYRQVMTRCRRGPTRAQFVNGSMTSTCSTEIGNNRQGQMLRARPQTRQQRIKKTTLAVFLNSARATGRATACAGASLSGVSPLNLKHPE